MLHFFHRILLGRRVASSLSSRVYAQTLSKSRSMNMDEQLSQTVQVYRWLFLPSESLIDLFSIFSSHLFSFNYRIFVLVLQLSVRTSWTIVFATFKQHSISKDLAVNKVKHFAVNLFSKTFFQDLFTTLKQTILWLVFLLLPSLKNW